ncbi:GNAT family N-acetyltransferase [Haloactinopolyspora alba]|uniref:GNAT family N-acetyltransferase n=1 Tax=Haloactinopolyspora alba TaxID=648780 RepID=UPI0013EBFBC5|nr:GNAT family N-acetyltransferase [Haloactinopolyspora alba]
MIWTIPTDSGPIVVREQLEPEDEPGILELFAACDDWFEAVTGGPSGPGDVQSLFYALPEGTGFEDKRLYTVRDGEKIVGLIDVVLGFPHRRACAVGTFLLAPTHRGAGLGTAISRVLLDEARLSGLDEVTAAATDAWQSGMSFLRSIGFAIGDADPSREPQHTRASGAALRRATLTLTSSP